MIAAAVIPAAAPTESPDAEEGEMFVLDVEEGEAESVFCASNATLVETNVVPALVMVVSNVLGVWVMVSVKVSVKV